MSDPARFVIGYLGASLVATAAVLVAQSTQVLARNADLSVFHDLPGTALLYCVYGLSFTLVLGVPGWLFLRWTGLSGALPYALVGGALGLAAAGFFAVTGSGPGMEPIYGFPLAGLTAALTFRSLFYGTAPTRGSREAAA
jgi:hypothetical protein